MPLMTPPRINSIKDDAGMAAKENNTKINVDESLINTTCDDYEVMSRIKIAVYLIILFIFG